MTTYYQMTVSYNTRDTDRLRTAADTRTYWPRELLDDWLRKHVARGNYDGSGQCADGRRDHFWYFRTEPAAQRAAERVRSLAALRRALRVRIEKVEE